MKQVDYEKVMPILDFLDKSGEITIQEAMEMTEKARTTSWRYMKMQEQAGVVETEGDTNNVKYKLVSKYRNNK